MCCVPVKVGLIELQYWNLWFRLGGVVVRFENLLFDRGPTREFTKIEHNFGCKIIGYVK